jgi:hypothetical protein
MMTKIEKIEEPRGRNVEPVRPSDARKMPGGNNGYRTQHGSVA